MSEKTTKFDNLLLVDGVPIQTNKWLAWLETKLPLKLFVGGTIECSNPGVEPTLSRISPQGINPTILLLRLDMVQRPGVWPQVVVEKPVKYSEIPALEKYEEVSIHLHGNEIINLTVQQF